MYDLTCTCGESFSEPTDKATWMAFRSHLVETYDPDADDHRPESFGPDKDPTQATEDNVASAKGLTNPHRREPIG